MAGTAKTYKPLVLVDTADLPEQEWLEYRRRGIGGSDAAAILGVSPFATARDLYYDKLKIVSYEDLEENWVQKKIGHLLEDLADVDYFVTLPDGETAILEIKTTNYNAKDHWWDNGNRPA